MLKKIISLFVIFSMLIPFSPAAAADESTPQPTIEEILNDYHQKAFEAQMQEKTGPAAYARNGSSSSKTLEQETVDTLTAAGYEAYNVTADNYSSLEADLNTDFSEMGLDPDGSYIIVISGEDSQNSSGRSIGGSDIVQQPGGTDGGSVNFEYTYNCITYTMRYLMVTSADNSEYCAADAATLISASSTANEISDAFNSILYIALDATSSGSPVGLGTLADLCGIEFVNIHLQYPVSLTLNTSVNWMPVYTQIYNEGTGIWSSHSCVDYVKITHWFTGFYYNVESSSQEMIDITINDSNYTEHYFDYTWRKSKAARGHWLNTHYFEYWKEISVYDPFDEFSLTHIPERLFHFVRPIVLAPNGVDNIP